jgi:cell division protein FtsB
MFQTKFAEQIKTQYMYFFPRKWCRLWANVEKYGTAVQATDENKVRRMRFASWITKAAGAHSEYVIIIAFPQQQWLRERASMLQVLCLSCSWFKEALYERYSASNENE